ncbi:MAG TPA: hypothetical protein VL985_02110 [Stellaceae bacterium]|nr:hypothetical protein [Stellaceae bacterium]
MCNFDLIGGLRCTGRVRSFGCFGLVDGLCRFDGVDGVRGVSDLDPVGRVGRRLRHR